MHVDVKFVHLVEIFAKVYQCEQGGQISRQKCFLPSDYFVICNLAIYIAVFRGVMVFLVV